MSASLDFYLTQMKTAIVVQFQYRVANYFYMIGMIAEPVVYLVVWTTVARAQGGTVGGYTAEAFAAYYIVWTLVRNMNIVLTPYAWENRIRQGDLAAELIRPLHPFHFDLAYFAGWKFVAIVMWLPIAVALALIFKPALDPTAGEAAAFVVALWGGFFVRFGLLWALGLVTFFTTRVSAVFELYFTAELLLSGRLAPISLMPQWVQGLVNFLPFKWAFGFPIEVLIGQLTPAQIVTGLLAQAAWSLFGVGLVWLLWRPSLRRFAAVGG